MTATRHWTTYLVDGVRVPGVVLVGGWVHEIPWVSQMGGVVELASSRRLIEVVREAGGALQALEGALGVGPFAADYLMETDIRIK